MRRNRTLTTLAVTALAALTQGLLLWLILGDAQTLFDSFMLAAAALALASSGEALRKTTGSEISDRAGLVFAFVLVAFGAATACTGKAASSPSPEAWNAGAFVATGISALGALGIRNYVEEA